MTSRAPRTPKKPSTLRVFPGSMRTVPATGSRVARTTKKVPGSTARRTVRVAVWEWPSTTTGPVHA